MTIRTILCEGPDDLNALRELAIYIFGATVEKHAVSRGGGEDRKAVLRIASVRIEIIVSNGGKSRLRLLAAKMLNDQARRGDTPIGSQLKRVAVVFDPDEVPETSFHHDMALAITKEARAWALTAIKGTPGAWLARRAQGER